MITSYDPYDEIILPLQILQVVFAPVPARRAVSSAVFLRPAAGNHLLDHRAHDRFLGCISTRPHLRLPWWSESSVRSSSQIHYVLEHKGVFIAFFLFLIPGIQRISSATSWACPTCVSGPSSSSPRWAALRHIMLSSFGSFARNNQFIPLVALLVITSYS